ncbi:DUF4331 domain-containing protein [Haliangium sp.]|uniref:DUF4331 domain-containing protein n=1 Tax=Haliangium sp. TaxID=2663208 RepID=UPI003D0D1EBE
MITFSTRASVLACAALMGLSSAALASSHREAPAIAEDQFADNTDVYTFISPEDPDKLVVVANYVPLLIPSSGPNFYRFSDNVAYDIHFDNDGDARSDVVYRFLFQTTVQNGDTFLYNTGAVASITDPNLNVRQTYDVLRLNDSGWVEAVVANDVPVAPWHVGDRSFPNNSYEGVAQQAIYSAQGGERTFAGPRDEPFFVDLHVFDLLGVGGAPTTDGVNVMSLVLEVPIDAIASGGQRPAAGASGPESVVGVHATASRRRARVLHRNQPERNRGRFVQVSRLGWPLVNEVVIPLKDKDKFNRSRPQDDLDNFGAFILFPELTGLLQAVLGLPCADTPADGRLDIAGLLSPNGTDIADLLRIDITGGQTFANTGFPNGRALEDDVVDTLLTVVCNGGITVADGVNGNDLAFSQQFPFLASPHSGNPLP